MKILLAGDWHGNVGHMRNVFAKACRDEADLVLQLGDFGYGWDKKQFKGTGGKVECKFSHQVSKIAQETGIPCYWIDGNHENFDLLESTLADIAPEDDGVYEIAPMVFYVPRGTLLTLDGLRVLCCGGAVSVDKRKLPRKEGVSWWPQEAITDADVEKCREAGEAHVVVSHDLPLESPIVDRHLDGYWGQEAVANTAINREKLSEIFNNSGARRLVHGHLHIFYREAVRTARGTLNIWGLDGDTTPLHDSTYLLDTTSIVKSPDAV